MILRVGHFFIFWWLILSAPAYAQSAAEKGLGDRLNKANVQANIERHKIDAYKALSSGIFNAPVIDKQIKNILARFKATGLINEDGLYETFLSSTPEINLSIEVPWSLDFPTYHVTVSKGFLDFITNQNDAATRVGKDEAQKLNDNSEAVLAAAIAHDLRHAMTPKTEGAVKNRNKMYLEFDADEFATRLLYAAGYPPNAMILYLEPWVIMQERSTLEASFARLMDNHPAARFRIAHLSDLVDTLSMSKRGKEEMGFDSSDVPEVRSGVIDRTGPESTSKTSFEAIQKKFASSKYLGLNQRQKLHFLEQYFTTSKTRNLDPRIAQSIVAVLNEYGRLASQTQSVPDLDTLINSLGRFKKSLDKLAKKTSDDADSNVKKKLTDLRALISGRHLDILRAEHPQENLVANVATWGTHVDKSRPFARDSLDKESVLFLHRALGDESTDFIFNDLVVKKFTLKETLDLLIAQDQTHQAAWETVKQGVDANTVLTPQDLAFQIGVVKRYLQAHEPQMFQAFASSQIETLKLSISTRQKDRALNLLNLYATAANYNALPFLGNDQLNVNRPNLPQLGQKFLDLLDESEKLEIFSELLRLQIEGNVRTSALKINEARNYVVESFDDFIKTGKATSAVRDEFMQTWDSAVQSGLELQGGKIDRLPESFFIEARKIRFLFDALYSNDVRLFDKTPGWIITAERTFFDSDNKGFMNGPGIDLLQKLLVPDKKDLLAYFAKPSANSLIQKHFALAENLTAIFSYYRGLGDVQAIANSKILSPDVQLALHFHLPAEVKTKSETRVKKGEVDLTTFLNNSDKETLVPYGPAFQEFIEATAMKQQRNSRPPSDYRIKDDIEAFSLNRAVSATEPIEALIYTFAYLDTFQTKYGRKVNEELSRLIYSLLTRSLYLVQTKDQMDLYSSLFSVYAQGHPLIGSAFGGEFLNAKPEALMDISAANYRQHFFNLFITHLNRYDSWTGRKVNLKSRTSDLMTSIARFVYAQGVRYDYSQTVDAKERPLLFRMWGLEKVTPYLYRSKWYGRFMRRALEQVGKKYIASVVARSVNVGAISKEKSFERYVLNTPYSEMLDESIADYVQAGQFESRPFGQSAKREQAIHFTQLIKSLRLRDATYRYVLATYGEKTTGYLQKLKDYWAFYKLYQAAAKIWSPEVIEKLKQVDSLFSQETMRIVEHAWDDFAAKKADLANLDKKASLDTLKNLWVAFTKIEKPLGSEIAMIFPEASRYRDPLLEDVAKARSTTFKQLDVLDDFKSRSNEAPYQMAVKALFELNDRYISKLTPVERAEVALYLADVDENLSPALEAKIKNSFYGSDNRRKAIKEKGFFLTLEDIKTFFKEVHPEEKLLGFKAMFVGGVGGHADAQKYLTDRLLLTDASMPPFLRAILEIHLQNMNESERSTLLSWLLANGKRDLRGPDIVKLFVERGGTAAAKLAQLIASHGLNLSPEYQRVLEVFKGDAQSLEKIEFLRAAKLLLPPDKFALIKTLDRELGSGSMKIGYLATLTDGRKFAIMIAREFIEAKTAREFEILRADLTAIMNRDDLRLDFLPGVEQETERIIKDEMKFSLEAKRMREHKGAHDERPFLVRYFGNQVTINTPQPIEGWSGEKILVEEFVDAKGWNHLPAKAFFGWSQEKLAKAAISETLNQMLAYGDPKKLPDGKVILDIDPHERNVLAQNRYFGLFKSMVNIDLGQSVYVEPADMKNLIQVVLDIRLGQIDKAVETLKHFMNFRSDLDVQTFATQLKKSYVEVNDPITALTKAIGETEMKGIFLKPEFLFFQKLFATLVGLQSHVSDRLFMTHQAEKILFWRTLASPAQGLDNLRALSHQNRACDILLAFLKRR